MELLARRHEPTLWATGPGATTWRVRAWRGAQLCSGVHDTDTHRGTRQAIKEDKTGLLCCPALFPTSPSTAPGSPLQRESFPGHKAEANLLTCSRGWKSPIRTRSQLPAVPWTVPGHPSGVLSRPLTPSCPREASTTSELFKIGVVFVTGPEACGLSSVQAWVTS